MLLHRNGGEFVCAIANKQTHTHTQNCDPKLRARASVWESNESFVRVELASKFWAAGLINASFAERAQWAASVPP